ncbi:Beta-1,2-xylosyltransferase 1-like protein [Cladobotryum mycophilum]|uniref:Beta-1,2-xylosyltransferase 1-like protein n=1 Tax=Cladobotryum mycophilum TaxID=491253 RepID=A0ABR0SDB4_9HYPO
MLDLKMRRRPHNVVAAVLFFSFCAYTFIRIATRPPLLETLEPTPGEEKTSTPVTWEELPTITGGPKPKSAPGTSSHPISYLMTDAQKEFEQVKKRQSTSLEAAVKEYRRRYGMPPPPHFDKWYEFAKSNGVQLVDEFDTIYDLITPFWGLQPKTIRSRVKEALGFDNGLVGVAIRNHEVTHTESGLEWQQNATKGMMEKFIKYLPDMDLAFNIHDEPRVMIPHDDLSRLVDKAKKETMAALNANTRLVNDFSARAPELNDGRSFEETKLSRFNVFPHQATWTNSRMSCPPDSPARILDDERADDLSKYGVSDLGFIYNMTAMSDICFTPSLSSSYGFFDRPNTYKVVHDLFPIFSQSKVSSYADIVYPSPWYWYEKVAYNEGMDKPWNQKDDSLYWRGSTTGGFSRSGHFVQKINSKAEAKIMVNNGDSWEAKEVPRGDYRDLIDVHFSHVGQCDPGDCEAQVQFFDVVDHVEQQDAWGYKYLLDIDGNAFSGRFYAFLQSHSLTFKLALFREWHSEWLKPWVHFVPMSLQGDDWLENVRFFNDSSSADAGQKMAAASREWANKMVRKEDMEAWFFRLLLEYARVIDDNRANLGFDPSNRE